jgi:predicted nuclease with TOPRIM domain
MATFKVKTSPTFPIERKGLSKIPPSIETPRAVNLDVSLKKLYDAIDECNEKLSNRNTAINMLSNRMKTLTKENTILKKKVDELQEEEESEFDKIAKLFHPDGSGSNKKSRKKRKKIKKKKKSKRRTR